MKITMVTHVPFWQRTTGAMARMWSIADFLVQSGHELNVFFVGHDRIVPDANSLPFFVEASYRTSAMARVGDWFRKLTNGAQRSTENADDDFKAIVPMQIDDFKDQVAIDAFKKHIECHQPAVVVFEYIAMTYLAKSLRREFPNILTVVDTHDVLSRRNESFGDHGHNHWLNVTPKQEAAALSNYDAILAIQKHEAHTFRSMVPDGNVLVAGHALEIDNPIPIQDRIDNNMPDTSATTRSIAIGFLGSRNQANADAIRWFVKHCWNPLQQTIGLKLKLLVTGGVIELLEENDWKQTNVLLEPTTNDTRSFYERIDVAINPVRFGSGLKIKNVEALLYGIPLVTTTHGVEAFDSSIREMIASSDTPAGFNHHLVEICCHYGQALKNSQSLQSIAKKLFAPGCVYSAFDEWLKSTRKKEKAVSESPRS